MKLAIISDIHCGEPRGRWSTARRLAARHDTTNAERLADIVDSVNASDADRCIVLGDVTDWASSRQWSEAAGELERLTIPFDIVPGNHDVIGAGPLMAAGVFRQPSYDRTMEAVEHLTGVGEYPYQRDFGDCRLLCLDSSAHGERGTLAHRGRIGDRQIAFLASHVPGTHPVVVALHHYLVDMPWTLAVEDAEDVLPILARDHVTVIHGHRHRAGEHKKTADRPRILASDSTVDSMRWRMLDVGSGRWDWRSV